MTVKLIKQIILMITIMLSFLIACSARDGQLKPLLPGGEGEMLLAAQPQLVTFSQLQADPDAFQDRLLRVSGSLLKMPPPECIPYSGPIIEWALIAEDLRLDAVGFERAIGLLDGDVPMTVDGVFRLYEGPLGCGKAARVGSAWYMDVIRIVQPNPLVAGGLQPGSISLGTVTPGGSIMPPGSTATPTGQTTPSITGTPGTIPTTTPTGAPSPIPTATFTPGAGTGTVTSVPTASPPASATSQFTPTPTPLPGTLTVTPTRTPTTTTVPGSTPTPTPTVGLYPGPGTPTPTPTVDGYPPLPTITITPTGYP